MRSFGVYAPMVLGAMLILYVFTFGGIYSNHSVQNYLLLCTGILSISLGLLGMALTAGRK